MKKVASLVVILLLVVSLTPCLSLAAENSLIQNVQISLKNSENPKRLEVTFDLNESIDLSKGSSNITYEYFTKEGENLTSVYKKDKSWSGYINSYDNYPSGEHKYSSGTDNNTNYSDSVPATTLYTSIKTNTNIDVLLVEAITITVLRENGSGEKVTIHSDGTTSDIEKIEIKVEEKNVNTGIMLEATTAELPANTVLISNEVTSGSTYELANEVLTDSKDFIVFEISLKSEGVVIQPDGMIKISIPIPESFNTENLVVYRIEEDGTKTSYSVTVVTKENVKYATFETNHFSIYALADNSESEENNTATNDMQGLYYFMIIMIVFAGIFISLKKTKLI